MLEALKAELPDAALVAPDRTRENLQTILDGDVLQQAAAQHGGVVVLWLDDLEAFVRVGKSGGLSAKILRSLKQELPGLVVAATAGGRGRVTRTDLRLSHVFELLSELMDHGITEVLDPALTTPAERDALAAIVPPDLALEMQRGLGAVAISGQRLVRILVDKSHPGFEDGDVCVEGAAVTWAAITAYRLGLTEPIPNQLLRSLFACYAARPTDAAFDRALEWATEPLYAHVALLRSHDHAYAPYDYVVQHAPVREDESQRCAWRKLLQDTQVDRLVVLALEATNRGMMDDAIDAWRRLDELGSGEGAYGLSLHLAERGDVEGAEAALRRGDDRGHDWAAFALGITLDRRGDLEGAEAAYRRADERGHAKAALNLGIVLDDRGDLKGAEVAWRRADQRGLADGSFNLGALLERTGDVEGAEAAYRRADQRGDAEGAIKLGILLQECGDLEGAEGAYRRADQRGHAGAAINLGVLLERAGDVEGAEAAWRRADQRGLAEGAFNLGILLQKRGDLEGAEAAYWSADQRGQAAGAFKLGALLDQRGDRKGADLAFRRAVERGHERAAIVLGLRLYLRGDLESAEGALRRALESSNPEIVATANELLDRLDR